MKLREVASRGGGKEVFSMVFEDVLKSQGVVTSRKCPLCGHHEVGITTGDGEFRALVPGMFVQIVEVRGHPADEREGALSISEPPTHERSSRVLWVPEELRRDRDLCLKYAVWMDRTSFTGEVNPELYERAYVFKLRALIEREKDVPVPVILDRVFSASHLSSGNPEQIAEAMWRELDEVRNPVYLMREWLKKRDGESLEAMSHPKAPSEFLCSVPMSDEQVYEALEALTLEEFLRLLLP